MIDPKTMKCIVKDCTNHRDQGLFTGDLCYPCHAYISRGEGIHSQAYRNTQAEVLKEREECAKLSDAWDETHPNTNYGKCIGADIRARWRDDA